MGKQFMNVTNINNVNVPVTDTLSSSELGLVKTLSPLRLGRPVTSDKYHVSRFVAEENVPAGTIVVWGSAQGKGKPWAANSTVGSIAGVAMQDHAKVAATYPAARLSTYAVGEVGDLLIEGDVALEVTPGVNVATLTQGAQVYIGIENVPNVASVGKLSPTNANNSVLWPGATFMGITATHDGRLLAAVRIAGKV